MYPTPENPCPLCNRTGEENDGWMCGCLYNCFGEDGTELMWYSVEHPCPICGRTGEEEDDWICVCPFGVYEEEKANG